MHCCVESRFESLPLYAAQVPVPPYTAPICSLSLEHHTTPGQVCYKKFLTRSTGVLSTCSNISIEAPKWQQGYGHEAMKE